MAPGERMITIPGFGDHVRADWPITINGMRTLFGARSEKLAGDAAQLLLALDDMSTAPREPEPEQATRQPRARPASGKPARNIGGLPKHLPREDVVIEPEANECPCCQGALHRIGEDVSEVLDCAS